MTVAEVINMLQSLPAGVSRAHVEVVRMDFDLKPGTRGSAEVVQEGLQDSVEFVHETVTDEPASMMNAITSIRQRHQTMNPRDGKDSIDYLREGREGAMYE